MKRGASRLGHTRRSKCRNGKRCTLLSKRCARPQNSKCLLTSCVFWSPAQDCLSQQTVINIRRIFLICVTLRIKTSGSFCSTTQRNNLTWLEFVCFPGIRTHYGCIFTARQRALASFFFFRGFLITHNDAPQSVGLLWTSDQSVAKTSTWQHITLTTDKHPCSRWDSNPQSQQTSGRRPTP